VSRYLAEDFYDLVDVDSFGSETLHLPAAIDSVKFGGLLFLTSTDGISSAGVRAGVGLSCVYVGGGGGGAGGGARFDVGNNGLRAVKTVTMLARMHPAHMRSHAHNPRTHAHAH
jgi:hypothetical protein